MHKDIQALFDSLEDKKQLLLQRLNRCTDAQLQFQPAADRWSMIMALDHIIAGERGMRKSEAELRDNPARAHLQTGEILDLVMEVLEKDVPVEVPDPSLEPENTASLRELIPSWNRERQLWAALLEGIQEDSLQQVMFSHPAAGPLDPVSAIRLAHAHFDTHRRQIDRLIEETAAE
jgi:hypothetical protein